MEGASLGFRSSNDAHEVMAHVFKFFQTGDVSKADDPTLKKSGDIRKVMGEAEINAQQK
jgi:hypothetical protein